MVRHGLNSCTKFGSYSLHLTTSHGSWCARPTRLPHVAQIPCTPPRSRPALKARCEACPTGCRTPSSRAFPCASSRAPPHAKAARHHHASPRASPWAIIAGHHRAHPPCDTTARQAAYTTAPTDKPTYPTCPTNPTDSAYPAYPTPRLLHTSRRTTCLDPKTFPSLLAQSTGAMVRFPSTWSLPDSSCHRMTSFSSG